MNKEVLGLRAGIAGYSFELIGCDTMHNADKFERFPDTKDAIDCRIEVVAEEDRCQIPSCTPLMQVGDWRAYPCDRGRRLIHRSRMMQIETDEGFTSVKLTFCTAMPTLPVVLYLQVQHMIGTYLLLHGGALIHSAALSLHDRGILLCGRSGVGKSTMARLLREIVPSASVLSEDMPALMQEENGFVVCGTPLCGDDEQCENRSARLSRVILLRRAETNRLITPTSDEVIYGLLTVVSRSVYAEEAATAATDRIVRLARQVPIVLFENDGTREAAHMLYTYLQNEPRDNI